VQISEQDVLALLDYETDLSDQEHQGKLWFAEYVKQESPLGILTGHSDPPHP